MTMQRGSMVFAAEGYKENSEKSNFGHGRGYYKGSTRKCDWIAPPPNTFFNHTHSRGATRLNAMGTKHMDAVAYGQLTGSFTWTFTLDYEYLHILSLIFDKYEIQDITRQIDGEEVAFKRHIFRKEDNLRTKSFCVRTVILNEMAGGPEGSDEITELRGCVVRNIGLSKAAGASQIQVSLSGFYTHERMYNGHLDHTDYRATDGQLAEYMCMFVPGTDEIKEYADEDWVYVANTESLTLEVGNNANAIYNTCSPFAGAFYEGLSDYKFSTSCYSNNPDNYKKRVYGGGIKAPVVDHHSTGFTRTDPMSKHLAPLHGIRLLTYDGSVDHAVEYVSQEDIIDAYNKSGRKLEVLIRDCIIKSLTWPKGENQEIQDNISSADCKYMEFAIEVRGDDEGITTFDLIENKDTHPEKIMTGNIVGPE